jgi:hypothetical protein
MAVLIPWNNYKSHNEAPISGEGIIETYFARMSANMSNPARYFFYAGWGTGNFAFKESDSFVNLIKEDALKLGNPIQIQKVILP